MYSAINPLVEALGYGADDRLVILHADDVGMCRGSNQAYLELHDAGIVKTGSVMVPCPWASEILSVAQQRPDLDLGIHLTLTCEYSNYRWGPIHTLESETGLVDKDGRFWSTLEALREQGDGDAGSAEMNAQVAYVAALGIQATHIDTHMGASLLPQFREAYGALGFTHKIPTLVTRSHLILSEDVETIARLESMGLPLVDDFRITPVYSESPPAAPSAEVYEDVLAGLSPGVTYFSLHPNAPGEIEHISPRSADWRIFEHNYFQTQRARDFLDDQGIISIGYREIMTAMREQLMGV